MMAKLQLIAALMVALSAVVLEAEAYSVLSTEDFGKGLMDAMEKGLSPEDANNLEKFYLFVDNYLEEHYYQNELMIDKLTMAMSRILYAPDHCDELSLGYIAKIAKLKPERCEKMALLTDATKRYAAKCLKEEFIAQSIKPHHGFLRESNYNHKKVEFINDEFIDDYWLENKKDMNPEFKNYTSIGGVSKSSMTIAKAILRARDIESKDLKKEKKVHSYLKKRLYNPCLKYLNAFREVMSDLHFAGKFFEGGYEKLISSLHDDTQKVVFRFRLCGHKEIVREVESKETSKKVVSDLESLIQN